MTDEEIRKWMRENWIDCTVYNQLSIGELVNEFLIEYADIYGYRGEEENEVIMIAVEVYKYLQHEGFIDSKGYVK